MGPTFVLLTASMLASQVAEGQVVNSVPVHADCNSGTTAGGYAAAAV